MQIENRGSGDIREVTERHLATIKEKLNETKCYKWKSQLLIKWNTYTDVQRLIIINLKA